MSTEIIQIGGRTFEHTLVIKNVNEYNFVDCLITKKINCFGTNISFKLYRLQYNSPLSLLCLNNDRVNLKIKLKSNCFEKIIEKKSKDSNIEIAFINFPRDDLILNFEITPLIAEHISQNEIKTNDYSKLYRNIENTADFTIFNNGKSIHVHKFILVLESDFFECMFSNDWNGDDKKSINIDDYEYDTIEKIIKYIYINEIDLNDFNHLVKIFEFSNYYQFNALCKLCINKFIEITGDELLKEHYEVIKKIALRYEIDELKYI